MMTAIDVFAYNADLLHDCVVGSRYSRTTLAGWAPGGSDI